MDTAAKKSRAQALDDFLLNYLPYGTDDDEHELVAAMLEAARRHIMVRLDEADHLHSEDEDDQPMREAC